MKQGKIHIRAPDKLKGQIGDSFLGDGYDALESRDTADSGFKGSRNQGFHLLGSDSRILGDDGQLWIADIRQEIDAEPTEGDQAQEDNGDKEHGGRDRPVDS
jgi:hypothetical protein